MAKGKLKVKKPVRRTPRKRRGDVPLNSLLDTQIFLAELINDVRRGDVGSSEGTKLAYIAGMLIKNLELTQIQERIIELEKRISP